MKTIIIGLLSVLIISTTALELPSSFKICSKSDPKYLECFEEACRIAMIAMADGLKNFEILPVEPLQVNNVKIGGAESSVSLKQNYWNVNVYGITKGLQIEAKSVDLNKLMILNVVNPQVDFIADYKINGRILVLPVYGEGKCNISMHDLRTKHEVHFEKYEKDGETYLRATKYSLTLIPKHIIIFYENLFNGDPVLGEQMNKFVNDNSDIIFKEFKGSFERTFAAAFLQVTNKILNSVPYDKLHSA